VIAFMVGTGRCGSTLIEEILLRHPGTGFISNLDDKFSVLNRTGRGNSSLYRRSAPRDASLKAFAYRTRLLESNRLRVGPSEGWQILDRHIMTGFSKPARDLLASDATPYLQQRTKDFFDTRMAAQGCDVFVHRLTGWPRTGFLAAAYPDMRVLHVVRDPRAIANSMLQQGWWDGWRGPENWYLGPLPQRWQEVYLASDRSFVTLAAIGVAMLLDAMADARALHPADAWLDVRYEDVLADPRAEYERILKFLDLRWDDDFEQGFAKHQISAERSAAFRRDLDAGQLAAMTEVLTATMQQWGYDLGADSA
jgi:hypothetical protein